MFSLAATPLSELASGAEPTVWSESSPSWKPAETTRADASVAFDPATFLSPLTFGGSANSLPPSVPLPPSGLDAPPGRKPGAARGVNSPGNPMFGNQQLAASGMQQPAASESMPLASGAQSDWAIVNSPSPPPSPTTNSHSGVTCVSASDCWAVGSYYNGSVNQTLIEHWDGTSWSIVSSPNTSATQNNSLKGVTCASASDCWAVGSYLNGSVAQTLIERWNGSSWSIVTSPNTSATQANSLAAVTCVSASDCWAVGSYFNGSVAQTLIERWDGSSWAIVTSPNTSATQANVLSGVTCVSVSDCWAVGYHWTATGTQQTLIEHWGGSSWAIVTSPNVAAPGRQQLSILTAVTCASASDCWAVGHYYNGITFIWQTLIERWDGTSWAIVSSPNTLTTQGGDFLYGVTCVSASACWAVGSYYKPNAGISSTSQTLIQRWDGISWAIVNSPNAGTTQGNFLLGVTCLSASECWAVGHYDFHGTTTQTLVERWNGSAWAVVASPNTLVPRGGSLSAVTCVSASDCWAVGSYNTISTPQTLIERWDGTSWAIVSSPNTSPTQYHQLNGVTCVSASDCWAVGYSQSADPITYQTLIMHWDGISWTIVTSPNPPATTVNVLSDVTCVSASDCWAVGSLNYNAPTEQTLIERWNGSSWTIVTSPNASATGANRLNGVTCVSASDCWSVGYYNAGSSNELSLLRTLIEHWDGTSWAIVSSPNPSATQGNYILYAVTCASASDCWAVGDYDNGTDAGQTLIERWDGTSWAIVTSPNTSPTQANFLRGVTCVSASECWAVGSARTGSTYQTLIEHWDGTSWAIVSSPNTSATQWNQLNGVACVSASECWAVGYHLSPNGGQTLMLRYTMSVPTPTSVVSRKTHGAAGDFDIDLRLAGDPGIECRTGGASGDHQVVITFPSAVTFASAAVTSGTGTISSSTGSATTALTVNLTGVTNAQTITLTLSGVNDGTNTGDVSVQMAVLLGDTTGSGAVNSSDISQTKSQSGQAVTASNFRQDVAVSGSINSSDISLVKSKSGTALP